MSGTAAKETAQTIGDLLLDFLTSGPGPADHKADTLDGIAAMASAALITPELATENYAKSCLDFLEKVKRVKGVPVKVLASAGERGFDYVSGSGEQIASNFPSLLPRIEKQLIWCVQNYATQSRRYFDEAFAQFQLLVSRFLDQVPKGGSKDKALRAQSAEIRKALRSLAKWHQSFESYKEMSFPAEVDYIFALESRPIAAVWHYSQRDETGEYQKTYNHRQLGGRVFAVRGNWAQEAGLMQAGPGGYLDAVTRPHQEIGCMCRLRWLHRIDALEDEMLTSKGLSECGRVAPSETREPSCEPPTPPRESDTMIKPRKSLIRRLFNRG